MYFKSEDPVVLFIVKVTEESAIADVDRTLFEQHFNKYCDSNTKFTPLNEIRELYKRVVLEAYRGDTHSHKYWKLMLLLEQHVVYDMQFENEKQKWVVGLLITQFACRLYPRPDIITEDDKRNYQRYLVRHDEYREDIIKQLQVMYVNWSKKPNMSQFKLFYFLAIMSDNEIGVELKENYEACQKMTLDCKLKQKKTLLEQEETLLEQEETLMVSIDRGLKTASSLIKEFLANKNPQNRVMLMVHYERLKRLSLGSAKDFSEQMQSTEASYLLARCLPQDFRVDMSHPIGIMVQVHISELSKYMSKYKYFDYYSKVDPSLKFNSRIKIPKLFKEAIEPYLEKNYLESRGYGEVNNYCENLCSGIIPEVCFSSRALAFYILDVIRKISGETFRLDRNKEKGEDFPSEQAKESPNGRTRNGLKSPFRTERLIETDPLLLEDNEKEILSF